MRIWLAAQAPLGEHRSPRPRDKTNTKAQDTLVARPTRTWRRLLIYGLLELHPVWPRGAHFKSPDLQVRRQLGAALIGAHLPLGWPNATEWAPPMRPGNLASRICGPDECSRLGLCNRLAALNVLPPRAHFGAKTCRLSGSGSIRITRKWVGWLATFHRAALELGRRSKPVYQCYTLSD